MRQSPKRVSAALPSLTGDRTERDSAGEVRLEQELRDLASIGGGQHRDWRQLEPAEVIARSSCKAESEDNRKLLAKAIFVGTAQALLKGFYCAPYASSPHVAEVDCKHLRRPVSRTVKLGPPRLEAEKLASGGLQISAYPGKSTLDACAQFWASGSERYRIAVARFSPLRNNQNAKVQCMHCRDDQLFLRSSYYQAFDKMACDLNIPVVDAIDRGDVICTASVGLLRGPLDEGAQWYSEPPRFDVLWAGLPPWPHVADQSQYAGENDRLAAANVVENLFAAAVAIKADVLILPPLGCGTHGCRQPYLDMASLINDAALRHGRNLPHLAIASDHPQHLEGGWWEAFEAAVRFGRPAIQRPVRAPPMPQTKDPLALAEKQRRLKQGANTPRGNRKTFL